MTGFFRTFAGAVGHGVFAAAVAVLMLLTASLAALFTLICAAPLKRLSSDRS